MKALDKVLIVSGAALFLAALIGAMSLAHGDSVGSDKHYCQMVQLYKDSGGDKGWPDYDQSIDCVGE